MPIEKVEKVQAFRNKGTVLMIGDGIMIRGAERRGCRPEFRGRYRGRAADADVVLMRDGVLGLKGYFALAAQFRQTLEVTLSGPLATMLSLFL